MNHMALNATSRQRLLTLFRAELARESSAALTRGMAREVLTEQLQERVTKLQRQINTAE